MPSVLGAPPSIDLETIRELSATGPGFLSLRRLELRNRYDDGSESGLYVYDIVERRALDAVAIVIEVESPAGPLVCLRSSIRPALLSRRSRQIPMPHDGGTTIWEIPAGLIEHDEVGLAGLQQCAARETLEEVGLNLAAVDFEPLGTPGYPSPGVMGELIYFLHAVTHSTEGQAPQGDGSPVEERAEIRFVPLRDALDEITAGTIEDLKTEVGIVRLARKRGLL